MDEETSLDAALGLGGYAPEETAQTAATETATTAETAQPESDSGKTTAQAVATETTTTAEATPSDVDLKMAATVEALRAQGHNVTVEEFKVEVERQTALLAEQAKADAGTAADEKLKTELRPQAQAIADRTALDPSDPKYLSSGAAEELWQEKWNAANLRSQLAEKENVLAGGEKERAISAVLSEFPGTDEEALRVLADSGKSKTGLQKFAQRQADKIRTASEAAVAKHVATTTQQRKTVSTPARGLESGAGVAPEMSLDEAME